MQTHTVRNKSKPTPIVTLTEPFLAQMLAARPESVSLVLARFLASYAALTGRRPVIQHDQHLALLAKAGADDAGVWVSRYAGLPPSLSQVRQFFADGFMAAPAASCGLDQELEVVEAFFSLLDSQMTTLRAEG